MRCCPTGKPGEVNKLVNNMVQEGILEYWSSGSTTLYGMKGAGKAAVRRRGVIGSFIRLQSLDRFFLQLTL